MAAAGILTILLMISAGHAAGEKANWTLLVYLDGDNNLHESAEDDLNEMKNTNASSDVEIAVLMDMDKDNDSRVLEVEGNSEVPFSLQDVNLSWKDEVDMGNPYTLRDFIKWGVNQFPAEHYFLVLWDHGNGVEGFCNDENGDAKGISMDEMEKALSEATDSGLHFDVIGFDACLMHMVEVDYLLKGYSDFAVGSEQTEPGDGWNYTPIFQSLIDNPSMSAQGLGEKVVEEYGTYYASAGEKDVTQSLVNLSRINELAQAIDGLGEALNESVDRHGNSISDARNETVSYDNFNYIDLYDFARLVRGHVKNTTVEARAKEVMDEINRTVVREEHGAAQPNSHGLSIYFPGSKENYDSGLYDELGFSKATAWDDFLRTYLENHSHGQGNQSVGTDEWFYDYDFNLSDADGDGGADTISIYVDPDTEADEMGVEVYVEVYLDGEFHDDVMGNYTIHLDDLDNFVLNWSADENGSYDFAVYLYDDEYYEEDYFEIVNISLNASSGRSPLAWFYDQTYLLSDGSGDGKEDTISVFFDPDTNTDEMNITVYLAVYLNNTLYAAEFSNYTIHGMESDNLSINWSSDIDGVFDFEVFLFDSNLTLMDSFNITGITLHPLGGGDEGTVESTIYGNFTDWGHIHLTMRFDFGNMSAMLREYIDGVLGNGDGTINSSEMGAWAEEMTGGDNESEEGPGFFVDGIPFQSDKNHTITQFENVMGRLNQTAPIIEVMDFIANSTSLVLAGNTHIINLTVDYDSENLTTIWYLRLPAGFVMKDSISSELVNVSGDSLIVIDPLFSPAEGNESVLITAAKTAEEMGYGVRLASDTTHREMAPGEAAVFSFTIINTGTGRDDFTIAVEGGNRLRAVLSENNIPLDAGETANLYLNVSIPGDTPEGNLSFLVTANSQGKQGVNSTLQYNIGIKFSPVKKGVSIAADRLMMEAKPGDTVSFPFRVRNTGEKEDNFTLSVFDEENLSETLSVYRLRLDSGEERTLYLNLTLSGDISAGAHVLRVKAASDSGAASDEANFTINVKEKAETHEGGGFIPGFEGAAVIAMLVVVALVVSRKKEVS